MMTIREAKRKNETEMLSLPDVVSVGIGMDDKGHQVIVVGLAHENTETRNRLPRQIEGFRVVVNVTGMPKTQ